MPHPSSNARPNAFISLVSIYSPFSSRPENAGWNFRPVTSKGLNLPPLPPPFLFTGSLSPSPHLTRLESSFSPTLVEARPAAAALEVVQLLGGLDLGAGALAADGQAHGVAAAAVGAHVAQAADVVLHDAARVVLDRHVGQLRRQRRDRLGRHRPHARLRVQRVLGHDARRRLRAEPVEALQRFLLWV